MKKFSSFFLLPVISAVLGCSPAAPSKVLNPQTFSKVTDLTEAFNPQVDILFVMDNSGSMAEHQTNLARNIDLFTTAFSKLNLSYHLGVTSSDASDGGRLQGSPSFVDNTTVNGAQVFGQNLRLGTDGSPEEHFFDPVVQALGPQNLAGANHGFLRNGFLVVIFITDAEDQSTYNDPKTTFDFLTNLKGNKKYLLSYGVIVPSNSTTDCPRDDGTLPAKIESFLGIFQNAPKNVMDLCSVDYGTRLAAFSKDIANVVGSTIFLNRIPDVRSITVSYGTQIIQPDADHGWAFDAEKNAVILGPNISFSNQPLGTQVNVSYNPIN